MIIKEAWNSGCRTALLPAGSPAVTLSDIMSTGKPSRWNDEEDSHRKKVVHPPSPPTELSRSPLPLRFPMMFLSIKFAGLVVGATYSRRHQYYVSPYEKLHCSWHHQTERTLWLMPAKQGE